MKKYVYWWLGFLLLMAASFAYGQNNTTLTGTVTDSDAQVWTNGTWTANIVVPGGGIPHYISGGQVPASFSGTLSSGGVISGVVGNNAQIVPFGTTWRFTVCSLTSAPCDTIQPLIVQGTTQNVGAQISAQILPPRINADKLVYAYNTTEILNAVQGNGYINTITGTQWFWNGTAWVQIGGSGGGIQTINANNNTAQTITSGTGIGISSTGGTTTVSNTQPFNAQTLAPINGTINFGDSTTAGVGATSQITTYGYDLQNDIPGGSYIGNYGVSGTTCVQIGASVWQVWNPLYGPQPLVTYEAGINDANVLGVNLGGENHCQLSTIASGAHAVIPPADQQMSSTASSSTGTWTAYAGDGFISFNPNLVGTPTTTSVSGSSRTYLLPLGPGVVYTWIAIDGLTGTFTVSVNGTLQTNLCTGTTTFNSFGCNGQNIGFNGGNALFGQVFTGLTTGSNNTVIITSTNSGQVIDVAAMTIPSGLSPLNNDPLLAIIGVLRQQNDNASAATAAFNNAIQAASTALISHGCNTCYFADLRNGVSAGSNYPAARAVNITTDFQAPGYLEGNLHPGDEGYLAEAKVIESASAQAGWLIATPNAGGKPQQLPPGMRIVAAQQYNDYRNDFFINAGGAGTNNQPQPGICLKSGLSLVPPTNCPGGRLAQDFTPYGPNLIMMGDAGGVTPTGQGCLFSTTPSTNDQCSNIFSILFGDLNQKQLNIGVNGYPTNPQTYSVYSNNGDALNVYSQRVYNSSIQLPATENYIAAGTTSVQLYPCTSFSGDTFLGRQYLQWFVTDSTSTLASLTFNIFPSATNDLVNGATSQTFTNIPPHSVFQVMCSQSVAATSPITITPLYSTPSSSYSLGGTLSSGNVALGAGAGSGATLTSIAGQDGNFTLTFLTGTTPSTSSTVLTVTFTATRGRTTYCTINSTQGTAGSAAFPGTAGATSFVMSTAAVPLTAATTYSYNVSCP